MKPWIRLVCLISLIVMLIGCGVRTTYNNLDWLAIRWLNQQINLTDEQEQLARNAINRKLAWHCQSELPAYINLIDRIDGDVTANTITVASLDGYGEEISQFGQRLLDRAKPSLIELLASLNNAQVEDIIAGIDERNKELIEEAQTLTPEAQREQQVDSMDRGLRRLIGRLSPEQKMRLEQWARERQPTAEYQRQQGQARDQQFIQALAVRNNPAEFEQQMNALFLPVTTDLEAQAELNQQRTAHNRTNMINTLMDIYELADERQINRLHNRLEDLAEDLQEVSCRAQT